MSDSVSVSYGSAHDPLCPYPDHPLPRKCVDCNLIRDVREDMLAKCIAAVEAEALHDDTGDPLDMAYMDAINDALAALRALQEKP